MATSANRARATPAQRAAKEWAEVRSTAEAAGYVNPYPEPGQALVATIENRCDACRWTLFVSMTNRVFCPNQKCSEYNAILIAEDVTPS